MDPLANPGPRPLWEGGAGTDGKEGQSPKKGTVPLCHSLF